MTFIPTPNAAKVSIDYLTHGIGVHNTFYVLGTAPMSIGQVAIIGGAVNSWWSAGGGAEFSNDISMIGASVWAQDSTSAPATFVPNGSGVPGGNAFPIGGIQVCMTISMRTGNRGRSGRGRVYLPGIPENDMVTPLAWNPAKVSALVAAWNSLRVALAGFSFPMVVVSKFNGGAPRTAGLPQTITDVIGDVIITTQRRRVPPAV